MDVCSLSLPLSNLMLSSEGFEKHEDRLPATLIGPQLLYASAVDVSDSGNFSDINSLSDGDDFHNKFDDDIMVSFEDVPLDCLTTEDVLGVVERVGPVESLKRLLLRALLDIPREPNCYFDFRPLPESSRDCRHVGDRCWHEYYRMSELSETTIPPKRYTHCDPSTGHQCYHESSPVLQIFDMKLRSSLSDTISPVEVYGVVAVRDGEDYCRNYLFNRSRNNPLAINRTSDHLRLMSPKRAMSMKFNCLIEVDIRVKAMGEGTEDYTLADGCMEFVEDQVSFGTLFRCSMDGPYGVAIFDLIMFEFGVEATIQLDFLRIPESGGFDIQMCGYTSLQKNLYTY
uniref:DUF6598 domain-containing protein n=1 Tax=Arundo donax TaxID=35708 RepID=A0A0A9BWJ7_ARUDO